MGVHVCMCAEPRQGQIHKQEHRNSWTQVPSELPGVSLLTRIDLVTTPTGPHGEYRTVRVPVILQFVFRVVRYLLF